MIDFNKLINVLKENISMIGAGILSTLILAIIGTIVGLIIGIFLAYGKNIKTKETDKKFVYIAKKTLVSICYGYSAIFRGTPMMVQALIFKYGCQALGLNWENIRFPASINNVITGWLFAGLIVITLNTAAYMAEIIQSGLNGVDSGQVEGARSLGMSSKQTSLLIILPQAIRNALPTIGNELIVNIKDSSVLNVIAVSELFFRIKDIAVTTYAFLECYLIMAVIYLFITVIATIVIKNIEKKIDGVKINFNPFKRQKEEF